MSGKIRTTTFRKLRDYIEVRCGLALPDEKKYLIETRLASLMQEGGHEDFEDFYIHLNEQPDERMDELIVDAMTTNETLWFRDQHPFSILKNELLPVLAEELLSGRRQTVRIWSAAASTGQEAYSIAMTVFEFCKTTPGLNIDSFEIVGSDISSTALAVARQGRYDAIAMGRGLPGNYEERFFVREGRDWVLCDEIRSMVHFQPFNLQHSPDSLGKFDIVFARYVAIYFSADFKRLLFSNIARSLHRPGILFIGAVESLIGVTDQYKRISADKGYYYIL